MVNPDSDDIGTDEEGEWGGGRETSERAAGDSGPPGCHRDAARVGGTGVDR